MSTPSISRYLKDFSPPKAEIAIVAPKYFPDLDSRFAARDGYGDRPPVPEIDIDAERREAFAAGRREATAELDFEHGREIAEINARHAAELEALRIRCDNEVAAMIYDRFCDMGSQLVEMLGEQTARVLEPLLSDVLLDRAIAEMARTVSQVINEGEACRITVKGPLRLFEALKTHFGDDAQSFRHIETSEIDLSVEFGDAVLVTRMAAWSDAVRKVLA